jgi:opacity protein-like surface antigen
VIGRLAFAFLLGGATLLHAQAIATASRVGDLQIGIGYTAAKPDYSQQTFQGVAAYADFDFRPNLGLEAEFHQVNSPNGDQSYQRTYAIGGRYHRNYGPIAPYAKAMIGRGDFNYPQGLTNLGYNLFAGGLGADYAIGLHLRLRGEYEYQRWSGFSPSALTPQLITLGIAYRFANRLR